jgi:hypothetical protein
LQGTIAQAAALAIFGNDILRGYSRENFWPAATVFKFCKAVRFVALSGEAAKPTESLFTEDPMQWISRLRDEGTSSLRLHHVARNDPRGSDRMSVGFVGGGPRWLMETQHARASDLWEARWQVVNKDDPDKKIWDVAYCRVDQGRAHIPLQTKSLTALRQDLMMALSRIEEFATRRKLEMFAGAFRKATAILSSADPLAETYHSDLAPTPIMPLESDQRRGQHNERRCRPVGGIFQDALLLTSGTGAYRYLGMQLLDIGILYSQRVELHRQLHEIFPVGTENALPARDHRCGLGKRQFADIARV